MKTGQAFNTLSSLAALCAGLAYGAAEPSPGLAMLTLVVVACSWWLARGGAPLSLPRWLTALLVVLAIMRVALQAARRADQTELVSYLAEFLVLVLMIKLFDRRTPRDDSQVLVLTLFIAIGALLTSNSLPVGFLVLLYAPLATASAMLLQVNAAAASAASHPHTTDAAPSRTPEASPPHRLAAAASPTATTVFSRSATIHFIGIVAVAVLLATSVSVAGFALIPRGLGQGALGRFGQTRSATVGFTDQVRLGATDSLDPSDTTPVLDVAIENTQGISIGDASRTLYLRGAARDQYDRRSRTWDSIDPRRDNGPLAIHPDDPRQIPGVVRTGPEDVLRISLRAQPSRGKTYLFSTWAPVSVQIGSRVQLYPPGPALSLQISGEHPRLEYTLRVAPASRALYDQPAEPGPFRDGPIAALARQVAGEAFASAPRPSRGPEQIHSAAAKIEQHLRTSYTYSLQPRLPDADEDPIEMFLFRTKEGHCEYFASAMVAMCQSLGLNARLITGYIAAEFNPVTSRYTVRQSNAHAWVEVSLGDGRWRTYDPSPPGDIQRLHQPRDGLLSKLWRYYDALEFAWNRSVVLYDEQRRSDLLERLGGGKMTSALAAVRRWFRDVTSGERSGSPAISAIFPYVAGAAVLLAAIVLVRRFVRRRAVAASDPQLVELLAGAGFYKRALRSLADAGIPKPDSKGLLQHARAVRSSHPALAELCEAVADLYYQLRFARRPLTQEQQARADDLALSIERLAAGPAR